MLRAAFNYVIDERKTWTAGNPASGITPFPETERERFLDGDELRRFLESLMQEPELWRDYFFLCLFAGQRRRNVQAMRWDEISLERASWTIPGYKSKNRKLIDVPLSNKALAILERRKQDATGEWVFPSPTSASGHIEEPKKVWKRILKRAKIRDLHLHDLRHTNASWQVIEGASLPVVGKTLGHLDSKTTQRYAHLNQAPGLESVNRACDAMLAAGGSSPVLLSDGK
jgi:integrase